jgi:diphthamide biosynthesis protein 4
MASNKSPKKKEPDLFEILSLTPKSLEGQDPPTQSKAVKQAYRRALLTHHPDKSQQAKAAQSQSQSQSSSSSSGPSQSVRYTVDQITNAYTVLSDSKKRREYTRSLQTQTQTHTRTTSSSSSRRDGSQRQPQQQQQQQETRRHSFRTGVETVDLDDMEWDDRKGLYYRGCRCGNSRGYCFREMDLEEVGEAGELLVECVGCSLWLRVLFEEAEDEDGDGEGQAGREVQAQSGTKEVRRASGTGKSGGWSWSFNFGISIGGSATTSAKTETS